MRIAQISTVGTPVRSEGSDSIESIVWLLTRELAKLGHEVTVFATAGSEVDGKIVATLPGPYGQNGSPDDWQLCEFINLCTAINKSNNFDVIHSHAYLWGIPLENLSRSPMVHTTHVIPDNNTFYLWANSPQSCVTAISKHQWSNFPNLQPASVIYHGIETAQFSLQENSKDYLCYLGRFISGKGPLLAIHVAKTLGIKLLLAGPYNKYYKEFIEPLVDGKTVEYVGRVSGSNRDQLLGEAKALLYPIRYPEPFGLVMVEAMMCGTPVAAINFGAVPEIIDNNITGCFTESEAEFPEIVLRAMNLNRKLVHERALERFSAKRMALEYLEVYKAITSGN